jgi:hypothetical protein
MITRPVYIEQGFNEPDGLADKLRDRMLEAVLRELFPWFQVLRIYNIARPAKCEPGARMAEMSEDMAKIATTDEALLRGAFEAAVLCGSDEQLCVLFVHYELSNVGHGFLPKTMTIAVGDDEPTTFAWNTTTSVIGDKVFVGEATRSTADRPQPSITSTTSPS